MSGPIKFDNGLSGIRTGIAGIQKAAGEIASKDTMEGGNLHDLSRSLVDFKVYTLQVDASAKVVEAVDKAIGTLLDIKT